MKKSIIGGTISGMIILLFGIQFANNQKKDFEKNELKLFQNEFYATQTINIPLLKKLKKLHNVEYIQTIKASINYEQLSTMNLKSYDYLLLSRNLDNYNKYIFLNNELDLINKLLKDFQDACITTAITTSNALDNMNLCTKNKRKFDLITQKKMDYILEEYKSLNIVQKLYKARIIKNGS